MVQIELLPTPRDLGQEATRHKAGSLATPNGSPKGVQVPQSYNRVELKTIEVVRNWFLIICSFGCFFIAQQFKLEDALELGDLAGAEKAIRWGASCDWLPAERLQEWGSQGNSLKFLFAQTTFDATDPNKCSPLAQEFLWVRDCSQSKERIWKTLIPYETCPKVVWSNERQCFSFASTSR